MRFKACKLMVLFIDSHLVTHFYCCHCGFLFKEFLIKTGDVKWIIRELGYIRCFELFVCHFLSIKVCKPRVGQYFFQFIKALSRIFLGALPDEVFGLFGQLNAVLLLLRKENSFFFYKLKQRLLPFLGEERCETYYHFVGKDAE